MDILKSCATAHNNHANSDELRRSIHRNVEAMENIIPLFDDDLKHEAYNQISIMYSDDGYKDKQEEVLEKALDASPSKDKAVKYASTLEILYGQNNEKIIAAYEKALSKPSGENEEQSAICKAHWQVGIAYTNQEDKSQSDIDQGAQHFEKAIELSSSTSQRYHILNSYEFLYSSGSKERRDVYDRRGVLGRIMDVSKLISKKLRLHIRFLSQVLKRLS